MLGLCILGAAIYVALVHQLHGLKILDSALSQWQSDVSLLMGPLAHLKLLLISR